MKQQAPWSQVSSQDGGRMSPECLVLFFSANICFVMSGCAMCCLLEVVLFYKVVFVFPNPCSLEFSGEDIMFSHKFKGSIRNHVWKPDNYFQNVRR